MIVGFTGTREPLKAVQLQVLRTRLWDLRTVGGGMVEFRHGDCVGADEQAAELVKAMPGVLLICHPPSEPWARAWTTFNDQVLPVRAFLDRNKDIVVASDLLVACPKTAHEELRSGTWSTVRYARKLGKPVIIVYPDGWVDRERV